MNWDVGVEVSSRLTFRPKFLAFPRAACVEKGQMPISNDLFIRTHAGPAHHETANQIYLSQTYFIRTFFRPRHVFQGLPRDTIFQ
jgi:hypothetical protein